MLSLLMMAWAVTAQSPFKKNFQAHIQFALTLNNKVFPASEYSFKHNLTGACRAAGSVLKQGALIAPMGNRTEPIR